MNTLRRILMALGIAAVAYAGGALAYGDVAQRYASWKFVQDGRAPAAVERTAAAVDSRADVHDGDRVGRLEIPRLGLSVMVFQGIEESALLAGAGHVPGTPSPGGDGNVVIAAHRDTYFRKLSGILAGDRIRVVTVRGTFEYVVDSSETVDPDETRVMESRDRDELTLITCYPFYFVGSAPKRFIVHAQAIEVFNVEQIGSHDRFTVSG
jgi:LPXTG-site transpeptidase (sortase) family protein